MPPDGAAQGITRISITWSAGEFAAADPVDLEQGLNVCTSTRSPADGEAAGPRTALREPLDLADTLGELFVVCVHRSLGLSTGQVLPLLGSRKYLHPGNLWEGIRWFSNTSCIFNEDTVRSDFPK